MQDRSRNLGVWPHLGYTQSLIERAAHRRDDTVFLAERSCAPDCRFYLVSGDNILLKQASEWHEPMFAPQEVAGLRIGSDCIFLGLRDEAARFALSLPAEAAAELPHTYQTDLRSIAVQGLVAPEHLPPLAEAKALLGWHRRHVYCAACGSKTELAQGGWRRDCPHCRTQHFPRTDPVVIMLAVQGERCLLGRHARFAPGVWSCLAGFVEPGETIEEAARRETLEEAGIRCGRVRYFASQPWPFPASLMIGCHAQAVSTEITVDRDELENARWFTRDEAAGMLAGRHPDGLITPPPVAIAHHIIRAWVEQGDDVFA